MTRPSKRGSRKAEQKPPGPVQEPGTGGAETRRASAEVSRAEAEVTRDVAEQARALAEEGRELAEEVRRGAQLFRDRPGGTNAATEQSRLATQAAYRAEAWFRHRFDALIEGVTEMRTELTRLREEAAELRQVLSDMQQAVAEEQIIAAERRATQRRMEREDFRDQTSPPGRRDARS